MEELDETITPDVEPQDDLKGELESAFAAAEEKEELAPSDARTRDQTGRFAKKEFQAQSETPKLNTPAPTQLGAQDAVKTPVSWPAERKAQFEQLPPELKQIIAERESQRERELTQKSQFAAEVTRRYEPLERVASQHDDYLQEVGLERHEAYDRFMQFQRWSVSDPDAAAAWFIQSAGADPEKVYQQLQSQPQAVVDPTVYHLHDKVANLERSFMEREQAARISQTNGEIRAFAEETDSNGNLLRPYFNDVYPKLAALVPAIRAENPDLSNREILSKVYETATWAHPDYRERLIAERSQGEEAKRVAEAKARTDRARRAGSSITGAPSGRLSKAPSDDLRAMLEEGLGQIM